MKITSETQVERDGKKSFVIEMEPANFEETGIIHEIRNSIERYGSDALVDSMKKSGGENIVIRFNLTEGRYDSE